MSRVRRRAAAAPEPGKPRLRVPGDPTSPTVQSRQRGALQLGLGVFFAIRNPSAHEAGEWTEQEDRQHDRDRG
ncbi:TIGR02391 family protein [Streptomyces sp. NPDC017993]|uniref:TIGR02391 family protein n=1 Tax=Streptomyces sp. NPDC017993 TaxID=3365027 RepID=UPI0037BCB3EE